MKMYLIFTMILFCANRGLAVPIVKEEHFSDHVSNGTVIENIMWQDDAHASLTLSPTDQSYYYTWYTDATACTGSQFESRSDICVAYEWILVLPDTSVDQGRFIRPRFAGSLTSRVVTHDWGNTSCNDVEITYGQVSDIGCFTLVGVSLYIAQVPVYHLSVWEVRAYYYTSTTCSGTLALTATPICTATNWALALRGEDHSGSSSAILMSSDGTTSSHYFCSDSACTVDSGYSFRLDTIQLTFEVLKSGDCTGIPSNLELYIAGLRVFSYRIQFS